MVDKRNFPIGERITVDLLARDPYPIFQEMIAHEPISWVPAFQMWMVTRREDCITILRNWQTFTMEAPTLASPMKDIFGEMMLSLDGPTHKRVREPFALPFRARHVRKRYTATIAQFAHQLIDGFEQQASVDLHKAFSHKVALYTIMTALGLSIDDSEQFREWYDNFAMALGNLEEDGAIRQAGLTAFQKFRTFLLVRIEELRKRPFQSVLSDIIHDKAHNLSNEEIVSGTALTFFGGLETTVAMLSNTIWALLTHPDQYQQVQNEPKLILAAIDESLRWQAPVQAAMRFPTRPVTLHGVTLQPRDKIYCMLGAANRDPAFFDNPDLFDIHRPNAKKHLSYAYGPHYCLGAPLAQLEGEVGLSILFKRLPNLRLHPDFPTAPYGHEFRTPHTLWVSLSIALNTKKPQ